METVVNNNKIKENSTEVLTEGVIDVIDQINEFVQHNDYQLNNPIEIKSGLFSSSKKVLTPLIDDLSLNQRKKFKRKMNAFIMKQSLRSANLFLHFLYKNVLKSDSRIRITYPEKQLQIMAAREKYMEARKTMLELQNDYVESKGNYYKDRLAKNQKIQ